MDGLKSRRAHDVPLRLAGRRNRNPDNEAAYVTPLDMLAELREDSKRFVSEMRRTHQLCDDRNDVASASLLDVWIDEAERRTWFLFEASRAAGS